MISNFIDGATADAPGTLELTDPATGAIVDHSVLSGQSEVDAAL
ncbi:hypothetical protein ATK36_0058 [Amycolatopsis sulphurea]|uniref:Aldehyde dehydrogenase family protein n=1 Tax=Amycolatopsis sulphurea TaxID=76022 RepID=A0A2A9G109_9PSEU|nr:hypothetical protein [Amycolatopsis sulphurea]PFG56542.1 hypothetical protein ATK36_0058 [Amycolatopsis sulphurea]